MTDTIKTSVDYFSTVLEKKVDMKTIFNQIIKKTKVFNQFPIKNKDISSETYHKLKVMGAESFTAHNEDATIMKDNKIKAVESKVTIAMYSGGYEITLKAIKDAKSAGIKGFDNLAVDLMTDIMKAARLNLDFYSVKDGTGLLALIDSSTQAITYDSTNGVSTIKVDNPGAVAIRPGMKLDFINPTNWAAQTATADTTAFCVDVDRRNDTIKVEGDLTGLSGTPAGDNYAIVVSGSAFAAHNGFEAGISDTTFQGLDPTLYSFWKSNVEDAGGAILTWSLFDDFVSNTVGKAWTVDTVESSYKLFTAKDPIKKLLNDELSNKFLTNSVDVKIGASAGNKIVTVEGQIPYEIVNYLPSTTMYLVKMDALKWFEYQPFEWLKGDSGKILSRLEGKSSWEALVVWWGQLAFMERDGHGKYYNFALS